jgi:hypothetical protein
MGGKISVVMILFTVINFNKIHEDIFVGVKIRHHRIDGRYWSSLVAVPALDAY